MCGGFLPTYAAVCSYFSISPRKGYSKSQNETLRFLDIQWDMMHYFSHNIRSLDGTMLPQLSCTFLLHCILKHSASEFEALADTIRYTSWFTELNISATGPPFITENVVSLPSSLDSRAFNKNEWDTITSLLGRTSTVTSIVVKDVPSQHQVCFI